jgi:hypothetical protein
MVPKPIGFTLEDNLHTINEKIVRAVVGLTSYTDFKQGASKEISSRDSEPVLRREGIQAFCKTLIETLSSTVKKQLDVLVPEAEPGQIVVWETGFSR